MKTQTPIVGRLLHITGCVQDTGFSLRTMQQAHRLHISGWIQSCTNGSISLHIAGAHTNVTKLMAWIHQGFTQARVQCLQVEQLSEANVRHLTHAFSTFTMIGDTY